MSYQLLALDVRGGPVQVVASDLSLADAYRRLAAEAQAAGDGIPQYQGRAGLAVARSAEGGPLRVFEVVRQEGGRRRRVPCPTCFGECDDPDDPMNPLGCPTCQGFGFVRG